MNARHPYRWFCMSFVTLFVYVLIVPNDAATRSQTPAQKPDVKTGGGITTVTFVLESGKLAVKLPDDIRAGDTISGTVVAEPKGQTPEERAKNQSTLEGVVIEIEGKRVEPFSRSPEKEREAVIQQTFWIFTANVSGRDNSLPIAVTGRDGETLARTSILIGQMFDEIRKASEGMTPSGAVITPDPKITQPPFSFPPVGQTGRNIVVPGPFDGNGANTGVRIGGWEDGDSMGRADLIAESPRKAVFVAPSNVIGPVTLHLTEGNTRATGSHRNVAVNLSAPKTNLLKGERTTLTVQVTGLTGIKQPVPLTLTYGGVIIMEGGPYQPLLIQPSQVSADGRYTTTRAITGVQAGGWTATATVVTGRFDSCLQDDKSGLIVFLNSVDGAYAFPTTEAFSGSPTQGSPRSKPIAATPEGKPVLVVKPDDPASGATIPPTGGTTGETGKSGGTTTTPPTGGNAGPPITLTGTGTMTRKGCIIVLSHNAPDRRVFSRIDVCNKTGDATVETTSPKAKVKITDQNIGDNTCPSK